MITLVFDNSFILPFREYVLKEKDKRVLVYLLNQINNIKSSYLYIYNYVKSTIYVDYLFEFQKDGNPLEGNQSINVINNEIKRLKAFTNKIQKLLKYVNKYSGAASYLDKDCWTYYNAGPIQYKDNMNLNLAKKLIILFFEHCLALKEYIIEINNALTDIYKKALSTRSIIEFNNYFYPTIAKRFLKHFDEFENNYA